MSSEPILRRLKTADRVWRQGTAFEWLLRLVKWACAALVLVIALDLIAQLNSTPRLILTVLLGLAGAGLVARFIWCGFFQHGPLLRIARLLESRDATIGSKLMNILQLQEQAEDPARPELTRRLAAQAIEEAGAEIAPRKFLPLLKSPTRTRSVLHAAVPLTLLAALALTFSSVTWRQVQRFLDPFGDHPPFSFTQLAVISPAKDGHGVIYRQPVDVEVAFTGHRPDELFLLISQPGVPGETAVPMLPMGGDRFVQQIDQVTTDLTVRAATTDRRSLSQGRAIAVILTPQLEKSTLLTAPPAYTKIKPRETDLPMGKGSPPALTALAGSTLTFTLASNRPLGKGAAAFTGATANETATLIPGTGDLAHTATTSLTAKESGRLSFDLRDAGNLQTDHELAAALTVTHDLPPTIEIAEPAADGFIVDTFETKIPVRLSDDYGLRTTRLHCAINGTWREPKIMNAQDDPPQRDALETLPLRAADFGAKPGDQLTFFADVTDIRPEPQLSRTRTLKLAVISEQQYLDLLRAETEVADLQEKYATLQDELERLAREQRELAEAAATAAKEEKQDPATQQNLAAQQGELNRKLEKLAEKMETTVRDQPLYDMEKSLQQVLNKEAEKIRQSVAQNKQDAAPGAPSLQLAKAGGEQAERLSPIAKENREAIDAALADAQKMQDLVKPLTAWQVLYEEQQDLASQTAALKQKKELSREDKLALQDMAGRERMVGAGLQEIAKQLREKADAAEDVYPEAAADARNIADAIEDAGLAPMADQASRSMLASRGAESHDRAESLRAAMEKLMPECKNCQPGMGQEFTQRLSLARSMLAGNTFDQMSMCKKFGFGKPGQGQGMGFGGTGGMMAAGGSTPGQQRSLLGGETRLGRRDKPESATASKGQASGAESPGADLAQEASTAPADRVTSSSRPATAATSDAAAEEYRDVVDAYFRKLTNPAKP